MTAPRTTATIEYPGPLGLCCTFQVGEDTNDTCDRPAPWVPADLAGERWMLPGWDGTAWCDRHRPQEYGSGEAS